MLMCVFVWRTCLSLWIAGFFILVTLPVRFGFSSYDKDPIQSTQSDVVPVTDELLKREGEPGPASPTFKMTDTSIFMVKKPYKKAEKDEEARLEEEESDSFTEDEWLFLEENEEFDDDLEVIDEE